MNLASIASVVCVNTYSLSHSHTASSQPATDPPTTAFYHTDWTRRPLCLLHVQGRGADHDLLGRHGLCTCQCQSYEPRVCVCHTPLVFQLFVCLLAAGQAGNSLQLRLPSSHPHTICGNDAPATTPGTQSLTSATCALQPQDAYLAKNYPGKERSMFKKLSEYQPIGRMGKPRWAKHT